MLKQKLMLLCILLVVVPIAIIGSYNLYSFKSFSDKSSTDAYDEIKDQAGQILMAGSEADANYIASIIDIINKDLDGLANSANLLGYISSKAGKNTTLNALLEREIIRITEGIDNACRARNNSINSSDKAALEAAKKEAAKQMLKIKIGEGGYPFAMDSDSVMTVHPNSSNIGKNSITDLNLGMFREILNNKEFGKIKMLNYDFEGRAKGVAYTYFPEWDWIICSSFYWDDLSAEAAETSLATLKEEIAAIYETSHMNIESREVPIYTQIRFIDETGQEVFNYLNGKFATSLKNKGYSDWFKTGSNLKVGEHYNSGVTVSDNTGKVEMRVTAPVYYEGAYKGQAVLNMNWSLVWEMLVSHKYGESGYVYIINEKGVLISHPQYSLTDQVNLSADKYGELATLTKDKLMKGESGIATYTFEGAEKFAAYNPIKVGNMTYSIAATSPVNEFLVVANKIKADAAAKFSNIRNSILISALVLAIIGSFIGFFASNGIAKPILKSIDFAGTIANGDLTGRISVKQKDEVGQLADALNNMAKSTEEAIAGIGQSSTQVAAASEQLSSSSESLSSGATEQAANLEETSASIEQLTASIQQNSQNSSEARNITNEVGTLMISGAESVAKTVDAMKKIAEQINIVNDIADQTNLLALNAAIEAARAGEMGKGFAVVAVEVRKLAERSQQAALEISDLAVNSVSLAEEAGSAMEKITPMSQKATEMVDEINNTCNEQATGANQINQAIEQLNEVTQQNSSTSEESSAAAEELAAQAQQMNELVARFKIREQALMEFEGQISGVKEKF
jgi:methyl-accepting chemotaxis protein